MSSAEPERDSPFFFRPSDIYGLRLSNCDMQVPLKYIDVDVDIRGFIANVTSVLVYKNTEAEAIQVIYRFPLDESSAVYRCEAQVDGRTIVAECQERRLAKRTYDEALGSGHKALFCYSDEEDVLADVLSMKIGNIAPGGEVKITLGYVTELKLLDDSGVTQFTLHTVLSPRYNPSLESGGQVDPPTVPYIKVGQQPYDFSIRAKVGNSGPISNIVSASDELKVEYNTDKTEAVVSLEKPFIADHDLSLEICYSDPFKPHVIIEKGMPAEEGLLKEDLVMLNFLPELKESDYSANHEFIIIIDRSGSMNGYRIETAKETLLLFLKSLPMGCYFNVIGFGSNFDKLFPEGSRKFSEENFKAAVKYQEQLDASFGCTEILKPLNDVYSKPSISTHSRQLFIITDGKVSNTNAVIQLISKNVHNTRVFTFGIGDGASTALVKGCARAGNGRAEFILYSRMQPAVMRSLKAAMQRSVTDLKLTWKLQDSPNIIQIPKELPPMFCGDRLLVYALSTGKAVLDGTVNLNGKIGERELNFGLEVHNEQAQCSEAGMDRCLPLHRLMAHSQIRQLQIEQLENGVDNKAAVILLSTASNIISQHTAMVGVDKEKSAQVTRHRAVREVPHMMEQSRKIRKSDTQKYRMLNGRILMFDPAQPWVSLRGGYLPPPPPVDVIKRRIFTYMDVVQLQTFCGSWKLNSDLEETLEVNLKKIKSVQPQKISDEVWATLLALAVLNMKYSYYKDEWEMIEMKAQQWLNTQQLHNHSLSSLLELATAAVSTCDTARASVSADNSTKAVVSAGDTAKAAVSAGDTAKAVASADDSAKAAISADDSAKAAVSADDSANAAVSADDSAVALPDNRCVIS